WLLERFPAPHRHHAIASPSYRGAAKQRAAELVIGPATPDPLAASGMTTILISIRQPVFACQVAQRRLGPRAEMPNDLGCGERAEPAAGAVIGAAREPGQEASGKQVAGTGGIDHPLDRESRHGFGSLRADDDTALFAPRHHRDAHIGP